MRNQGVQLPRGPAIRTLMEMPGSLAGVGMTCRSILMAAVEAGAKIDLFTSYLDGAAPTGLTVHSALPGMLRILPYSIMRHVTSPRIRRQYLASIGEDEIAYLWPSVGLPVYEALAARGVPIVAETVNTRMAAAKPILDAAYEALGMAPGHGITDAGIADQNARHALCSAIFAPSPAVEHSFTGTELAARTIPTSYGTLVPEQLPPRPSKPAGAPVVFLFLGRLCVRKGAHLLLEAWQRAPKGTVLRIVGGIEPDLRILYGDVLNALNVSCTGFTRDVGEEYERADVAVFPSLEEGDPIATYEAAAHGVPIIASQAGAGRIGAETSSVNVVDPTDIGALRDKIAEFAGSEELRRHWGVMARDAVRAYDWRIVAPRRFKDLYAFLNDLDSI